MTEEEKKSNIEALKEKDRRSDLKSFCKYILEKIGDLKTNSSDRAIWELCQNARDLSDGATIKITLDEGKLTFAHKGMPFNDDSLISLVKQVSSNSKEGEDSAGQFGTGFVTTHDFSRKIYINGSFQTNSGSYIDIDNFELDRSIDEIDAFIKAMDNQIQSVYDLMEKDESPCREWTEFIYPLTPEKQVKVQIALSVSEKMMPYVLVINDRIKTVTIHKTAHNTDDVVTFTKSESAYTVDNLYCREVYIARQGKDTETFKVFYLQEDDNMVILPLSDSRMAKNVDGISKLFVWFPLLETEDFGTSFIYHSKFYPLEPRNGIVLPCDNDNVKSKYTYNTERVAALDNMLFEYLKTHVSQISNTIELAKVNFLANITKDEKTLDFYNTRQKAWTSVLRSLPLIDTLVGRKSLDDGVKVLNATMCTFFSDEENYTKYFDSFYEFAVSAATLPVKDECLRWSKIIHEWNLEDGESHYLQLKTVAEKVSKQNDISKLHDLLEIFKACASQEDNLFDNYSLIPNREGELRKKKELYDGKTINDFLYARAKAIAPEAMATLVNPAFVDICGHNEYTRDHMKSAIEEANKTMKLNTLKASIPSCFPDTYTQALRNYSSIFQSNSTNNQRNNVMLCLSDLKGFNYEVKIVEKATENENDLYFRAFIYLLESELFDITTKAASDTEWLKINKTKLVALIEQVNAIKSDEYTTRLLGCYPVIPNQNGKLCKLEDLRIREDVICDDLVEIYQKAFSVDLRDIWVDADFAKFVELTKKDTAKEISAKIERQLLEEYEDSKHEVVNPLIIEIIEKIESADGQKWKEWFRQIENNKADLNWHMVPTASKPSFYRLMKVAKNKELLEGLAELSEDIDKFYDVKEYLRKKAEAQAEFDFKMALGKHIESLIREKLGTELKNKLSHIPTIDDRQVGQDIIITYDGKEVFFIECKAKKNFNEPAHMSKAQMQKACEEVDRYALCAVDLTGDKELDNGVFPSVADLEGKINIHLDMNQKLAKIVAPLAGIKEEWSDNEITLSTQYQSNIPKSIFVNNKGFDVLVDAIVEAIRKTQ